MATNEVGGLPGARGSMWPSFGIRWNQLTGRKILFVQTSADGTGQTVASDHLGYGHRSPTGTLYANSVTQLNLATDAALNAGYTPVFRGIQWCQGENDGFAINNSLETKADYKNAFIQMIADYVNRFRVVTNAVLYLPNRYQHKLSRRWLCAS